MKRKIIKILTIALALVMTAAVSVSSFGALTLYSSEGYTYVDLGNGNVALYSWDNSSPLLTVKSLYSEKPITSVYRYAFQNNDVISEIDFSQAYLLRDIGNMAFSNCTALSSSLVLPNTLDTIGMGAFQNCTALGSVTIANVEVISQQCFYGDSMLRKVNLPVNLKRIEKLAFAECAIGNIFIPRSVQFIDQTAFENCRSLNIQCYYDSYAYHYALDNNISYTLLDGVKLGDADGDGSVNVSDVTRVQRYLAELETLEGIYLRAADANQDGTVDISDATALQMYIAEYDLPYPIGEVITQ